MATADELLRSVALQPNPEGHIVVGGDRFITIPDNLKRLGVQYDHNMETVTFDCPRYWDERDMTTMAVYINYRLSNEYMDRYPADNVRADGDIMHFEWTISRNVTQVPGAVSFIICVMKTDAEGNEERHWNSELCSDAYISPGMEVDSEDVIDETDPDLVTQLLLRMATVEQINVQAEEMQALYESTVEVANTAEETKNQALDASNYIKNTYSNAIKGTACGETIRVDDVSPIEHQTNCWVHGDNFININAFQIGKSISCGGVGSEYKIINGDKYATIDRIRVKPNTEYICTLDNTKYWVDRILEIDASGKCTFNHGHYVSQDKYDYATYKFTTTPTTAYIVFRVANKEGVSPTVEELNSINLMLAEYESDASGVYEPYIDPTTVTVSVCGKNLLPYPYPSNTKTLHGITITEFPDGTFIVNGTATAECIYFLLDEGTMYLKGKYTLSGIRGGSVSTYYLQPVIDGVYQNPIGNATTFDFDGRLTRLGFYVKAGTTIYNLQFKVQLEAGDTATEYEQYSGDRTIPSSSGTCIINSNSPTMTLYTDTPGVIIEAVYNVDTMKFLEANIITDRIQAATDAWLEAHYTEAEGVGF